MKKIIILSLVSLLFMGAMDAQLWEGAITTYIHENGYAFRRDDCEGNITLYTLGTPYVYEPNVRKDGSPNVHRRSIRGLLYTETPPEDTARFVFETISNEFVRAGGEGMYGEQILMQMIIDSDTGQVIGVVFRYNDDTPFNTRRADTHANDYRF